MNKNAEIYYESARRLRLPVTPIKEIDGFKLTLGKGSYFFRGSITPLNNASSTDVGLNKYCLNRFLAAAQFPVPRAEALNDTLFHTGDWFSHIAHLRFPLVVKPVQEGRGKGVICNIQTISELQKILSQSFQKNEYLQIEEFHGGLKSYRVLVLKNKILGVVLRHPSQVIGDGHHRIDELIQLENEKRPKISSALAPINIDEECHYALKEQRLTLDYIPYKRQIVSLGYTSNASRGGTYESLGTELCKENKLLMLNVVKYLNLEIAGIDVQCEDINRPFLPNRDVIIEVNPSPSIRIHDRPMKGVAVKASSKIIRQLVYKHWVSYLWILIKSKPFSIYIKALMTLLAMEWFLVWLK